MESVEVQCPILTVIPNVRLECSRPLCAECSHNLEPLRQRISALIPELQVLLIAHYLLGLKPKGDIAMAIAGLYQIGEQAAMDPLQITNLVDELNSS